MIYFQLKHPFDRYNAGDLFTGYELKRHKTSKHYPTREHCRVIATSSNNTIVKDKHRTMKPHCYPKLITENGGDYRL